VKSDRIRVIIPDSHGSLSDKRACSAFLKDLKVLQPNEIVMLGDHVDCGGLYSKHTRQAKEDQEYSYFDDIDAASAFLDQIQETAPNATIYYLEGNHEYHIERWAVENLAHERDIKEFIRTNGPEGLLKLNSRGIKYFRRMGFHHGLSIPGTIRLGKCYFNHGLGASKQAASVHLHKFSANICFGHTHRMQSDVTKTVQSGGIGAWSFGTLAQLQPTYMHNAPSDWVHGYGIQGIAKSGNFQTVSVSIVNGVSFCNLLI
jgi:predicted phosphodiesterase